VAIRFDYLRGGRQVSSRCKSNSIIPAAFKVPFSAITVAGLAGMLLPALPAAAQYPGQVGRQIQGTANMRAVGVLEWTGDEEHPKASRLVPVSVYDGQELQDGGVYLARPAPLALSSEVEYELKQNGKTVGLFDIDSAGQELGAWVGLGRWKPLPKPKPPVQVASTGKDIWGNDDTGDRPVLHRKEHDDDKSSGSNGSDSGSKAPAADPDRPTLHKKSSDDSSGDSNSKGSAPEADPDRPTLKKQPDNPKQPEEDVGHVESVQKLTDPSRPHLLRGKPADQQGAVLPTLMGLPPDMHQAVAVSDARNRPEHIWSFSWANPGDEAKMKADMEDIARKELGLVLAAPPPPAKPRSSTGVARKAKPVPPPTPLSLLDEQFRVFELAYGSGATLVLSAHTDGQSAPEKFVTLICQPDLYGNVMVLLKNVTDVAHLDETPRMHLVDAVDALADNRGELLFELRGATQRQFALYRVLRGQVDKIFVTGPVGAVPPVGEPAAGSHT
jgi:hypothetical protein